MSDRRTVTPADVPKDLVDVAERAITAAGIGDPASDHTPREAIRIMLAVVLPMYELRLGAELGRLTMACSKHSAPAFFSDCGACHRYAALVGARRLIEGRDGCYAAIFPRHALQEADDGTG